MTEPLNPRNLCRSCGEDFNSLELFDRHQVGSIDYNYSPERPDGRRCLDTLEMRARGWTLNDLGRWIDPVRAARASQAFTPGAQAPSRDEDETSSALSPAQVVAAEEATSDA